MLTIKFLVTVVSDVVVAVQWLVPLGKLGSGAYQTLERALEELHGVESVVVGRYSAQITVAPHVVSANAVAAHVYEALTEDEEFEHSVRFLEPGVDIAVESAAGVVRWL